MAERKIIEVRPGTRPALAERLQILLGADYQREVEGLDPRELTEDKRLPGVFYRLHTEEIKPEPLPPPDVREVESQELIDAANAASNVAGLRAVLVRTIRALRSAQ